MLVHCGEAGAHGVALVQAKGVPVRILALCDRFMRDGQVVSLNDKARAQILAGVM